MGEQGATTAATPPRGSLTLGRLWGVPVRLHGSFLLLAVGFAAWRAWRDGLAAAADGLLLGAMLFGSVLLHELGHARVGRSFGVPTRDVTLYPFGGVAAMRLPPENSRAEFWIAVAGPGVNVAVAALGGLWIALELPLSQLFVWPLVAMNLGMALFNLAPAYPMDGGRVLRAWLAHRKGLVAGTVLAIRISRFIAWGLLGASLSGNPALALAGGFLLLATGAERRRWEGAKRLEDSRKAWRGRRLMAPPGGPFAWRDGGLARRPGR